MSFDNKYIQLTKSHRYSVVFPEHLKNPRRLGRFDTIEQARMARDNYLAENGYDLSARDIQGKAEIEQDGHFFFAVFSDSHGGDNQGLLNPETQLDDDGTIIKPKLTKMQTWLWELHKTCQDKVFAIAGNHLVVLGHVGDLTQGQRYKENHVSDRLSDQIFIAYYNLLPWFERGIRKAILLKGTSSHSFGDGSSDLLIAEWLKTKYPDASIKSVYHALLQMGIEIDLAHHGPHPGSRNWTRGNIARSYLLDCMLDAITEGEKPSRLFLRGHYHQFVREFLYRYGHTADLIVLPSFCGLGAYGQQATKSIGYTQHGMVLFEIQDGRLKDIIPIVEKYDTRVKVYL